MYTAAGTIDTNARIAEFAPLVRRMARHLHARLPVALEPQLATLQRHDGGTRAHG